MPWAMAVSSPPTTRSPPSACAGFGRMAWPIAMQRRNGDGWGRVAGMDTLQAAVLDYRLDKLPDVIAKRRANAALYQGLLRHDRLYVPPCRNEEFNTFHTFVVQVARRDELQQYLRESGIKPEI